MDITVKQNRELIDRMLEMPPVHYRQFYLRTMAEFFSRCKSDRKMLSETSAKAVLFPHQLAAADHIIHSPSKGGILADEVGLGKTIEAGIIIKELIFRKEVEKVLVLAPASLTTQWREEMAVKFNEFFTVYGSKLRAQYFRAYKNIFNVHNRVIISIDAAKSDRCRAQLLDVSWDLVLVDEAHNIRNSQTDRYQLVSSLSRKYLLLLTATPLQNNLDELFTLIGLVSPLSFSSFSRFEAACMNYSDRTASGEAAGASLNIKLRSVMVRNRKSDLNGVAGLTFVKRNASLYDFELSPGEQSLYDEVTLYVKEGYAQSVLNQSNAYGFYMILVQKLLLSSPRALRKTLEKRTVKIEEALKTDTQQLFDFSEDSDDHDPPEEGLDELDREYLKREQHYIDTILKKIACIEKHTKIEILLDIINRVLTADSQEKILIFTEFYTTQEEIVERVQAAGFSAVVFNGRMSAAEKDDAVLAFRHKVQVLVATEAGGEGRNLQFCHILVNYDLPWNPMKVEQRIGRVHRIGQNRQVEIINLMTRINQKVTYLEPKEGDTVKSVEEYIIHILEEKINLFRDVVGDLDVILGVMAGEKSFDQRMMDIIIASKESAGVQAKNLDQKIEQAVKQYKIEREFDERTFRNFDLSLKYQFGRYAERYRYREDNNKVRAFMYNFFKDRRMDIDPGSEMAEIRLPSELAAKYHLAGRMKITFDKEVSIGSPESIEYITFDHPLFESALKESYRYGQVGEYNIRIRDYRASDISKLENWRGVLFNFVILFKGLRHEGHFFSVLVNDRGETILELERHPEEFFAVPFVSNRVELSGLDIYAHFKYAAKYVNIRLKELNEEIDRNRGQHLAERQLILDDYYADKILENDKGFEKVRERLAAVAEETRTVDAGDLKQTARVHKKFVQAEQDFFNAKIENIRHQEKLSAAYKTQLAEALKEDQFSPSVRLVSLARVAIVP